jgi:peptidoglycan/xylan/chitin deacetylase (PgdA/CDA1 family)
MLSRRNLVIGLVVVGLIAAIGAWRISKARCYQLVGDLICHVKTGEKVVALSFDDGPTPEGVDAVLATLEPRKIKATFFLIGGRMEKWPGQAKRLVDAGHELGNHSYSHTRMIGKWPSDYDNEIARTDRLIKAEGYAKPTLFRPPFGKRLIGLPMAVERAGYRMIMWDVEDNAEQYPDPKAYAADILVRVKPGSIILMHPMYRHNQTARDALPLVLDGLKARGYRVVSVGEMLALKR